MSSPYEKLVMTFGILLTVALVLAVNGCEPYRSIEFDNKTSSQVNISFNRVPLDSNGVVDIEFGDTQDMLKAGESKEGVTRVYDSREVGSKYKYSMFAISEKHEVLIERFFTWDELQDMDWKVVIDEHIRD